MSPMHGKFVWYKLMTSDTKAAETFYRNVMDWGSEDSGMKTMSYTLFQNKGERVGGLMPVPDEAKKMGAKPCWIGYIAVDDCDDYAAKIKAEGGKVHRAPADIPGVGRFAMVADPGGAMFAIIKGIGEPPAQMPAQDIPGRVGWHELYANDWQKCFAFYSKLFGWTKGEALDMGPMGTYQLFATGGNSVGGMMNKPDTVPVTYWGFYVNQPSIDAAIERATKNGGTVLMGPHQVPGGSWIVQCLDPQGAFFAMVAPKK